MEGRDVRREDIPEERILVPDQGERLCELCLRIGVVLEGLGGRRCHSRSGGLFGCGR